LGVGRKADDLALSKNYYEIKGSGNGIKSAAFFMEIYVSKSAVLPMWTVIIFISNGREPNAEFA
jgi:hypothetical protein